ncbi:MAG: rod shape-determining protein MreD [Tissierellia bacterium]|nr:rod shape-determining protein MreD [Tissierellia bacterium]
MVILILVLVVLVNLILQTTIFPYISVFGVEPNLALLAVISMAIFKGRFYGSFLGLTLGIIQDILFSPVLGVNSFILFFAGYLVGLLESKIIKDNLFIPILLSILGTIYYNFTYYIFMFFLSKNISFISFTRHVLLIETIYNCVLAIPIYKIFSKIYVAPKIRFGSK